MKITISREGLLEANNSSINEFLKTKPQNKLFRLDTTDQKKPEDFGIKLNAYRPEKITDKGYAQLPFSFHHLPLYNKRSIAQLLSESDIDIPAPTRISTILPLIVDMDDITPEQLATLLEKFKQKQTTLNREREIHDKNKDDLEAQDRELKEREEKLNQKEAEIQTEQQKLQADKVEFNLQNTSTVQREKELDIKSQKIEKERIANETFRNKLQVDMDKLTQLQLSNPVEIDDKEKIDDSTSLIETSAQTAEPSAPSQETVSMNPDSVQVDTDSKKRQTDLDKLIKIISDQNMIANSIAKSSDQSVTRDVNLLRDSTTSRDPEKLHNSTLGAKSESFLDSGSNMTNIPVPLLSEYNAKNIDDFIEALSVIKKYYKSEHSLILTILLKSKKLELIPLMSVSEREDVTMFAKFLRRYYNSSDFYSLREKYENLKQEQENSVVYLRKVMRLYYISKNLEPPSELRLVENEAVQKDIQYKYLRSLKNEALSRELTLRDPSWNELPELSSRLEDIHRRLKSESVSLTESVNELKCFNCGSRSHLANECRASRKDRRSFNRRERRDSRGRSRNRSSDRSRERYPYRKSPYPSQTNRRSSSRDRDNNKYRSRSQSYRSSRSQSRERYRSKSMGRGDSYNRSDYRRSSRSPYRHRHRSNSRDNKRHSKSPRREGSNDRMVRFNK